jgi:ABC-type Mn2+/Zn2+ transport system ATPase subunit
MSSEPQSETGPEQEERPRLASVEIGSWPGLGGNVGFDLGERVTVLVGKNGAGKSLIMEGLNGAVNATLFGTRVSPSPKFFHCQIAHPTASNFSYEYRIDIEEIAESIDTGDAEISSQRLSWNEACRLLEVREDLWTIRNGQLLLAGHSAVPFPHDEGLVTKATFATGAMSNLPQEAKDLAKLFQGVRYISAGIPRQGGRNEILHRRIISNQPTHWRPLSSQNIRISGLASTILQMESLHDGCYEEFVELLQQLGVVSDVSIRQYGDTQGGETYHAVHFDGVNIGFCSDGTQRIAQIIAQLLSPRVRCLLIEEPETAVHPSLLARLLAILQSYSHDRQIIIATHSPQIVDWCQPKDLRLVERVEGQTRVRKLDEKELGRVYNYLAHDGTLSDFVYGQSSE